MKLKPLTTAGVHGTPVPLYALVRGVSEGDLTCQEAWLALCISYSRDFMGKPHPTNKELASMMKCSPRHVVRLMGRLERKSVATRTGENNEQIDLNPALEWRG